MTSAQQATFIHIWISPARCPRRMQSSTSSQKTPKYKKLSRKRKTAQNLSILSCFMMECRWWDSNPHGFPSDFESLASAIPPHRRIVLNDFYYTGFPGQNQEKVCVFFQIVPHGVKYMTPVLARRRRLCYTKVRSKRK